MSQLIIVSTYQILLVTFEAKYYSHVSKNPYTSILNFNRVYCCVYLFESWLVKNWYLVILTNCSLNTNCINKTTGQGFVAQEAETKMLPSSSLWILINAVCVDINWLVLHGMQMYIYLYNSCKAKVAKLFHKRVDLAIMSSNLFSIKVDMWNYWNCLFYKRLDEKMLVFVLFDNFWNKNVLYSCNFQVNIWYLDLNLLLTLASLCAICRRGSITVPNNSFIDIPSTIGQN